MSQGHTYPGSTVRHGRGCTCGRDHCDPEQIKLAAARAAHLAAKAAPAAATPATPRPDWHERYRAAVRRIDADRNTRRMRELLRDGRSFSEAAEIIEREQNTGG
jgi:hypothetical protein